MTPAFTRFSGRLLTLAGLTCGLFGAGTLRGTELEGAREGFLSPARGEVLAPGSIVEVRWSSACNLERDEPDREEREGETGERDADEAEILLSLDGGLTFPIRVSTELSPCASELRWRVPALPTAQARLALRTGEEGREETEEIQLVSEPFAILADAAGASEALVSRGFEWWTPQHPHPGSAEDALDPAIGVAAARSAPTLPSAEIGDPASVADARRSARASRAEAADPAPLALNVKSLASTPAAPIPLRC